MELPTNLASSLQRTVWWQQLEPQWQRAFQEVFFKHSGEPSEEELEMLCSATVLRLAGATAPHTNMSFELTNLSGIVQLTNLEILIVTFHQLETVKEVEKDSDRDNFMSAEQAKEYGIIDEILERTDDK